MEYTLKSTPRKGGILAASFRPFIGNCTEVSEVVKDIAKSIDQAYHPLLQWTFEGKFVYGGLTYTRGINDHSALDILKHQ